LNLKKNPQNHKKELLEKGDATEKLTDQKGYSGQDGKGEEALFQMKCICGHFITCHDVLGAVHIQLEQQSLH
jgi:hypothetical protein